MGVLKGIRVLDLSTIVAGPAASMILADLGADVIKVEPLGRGEDGRAIGPHRGTWGPYFATLNRGKRSIALDLGKPEAREILFRVAKHCDVWLENFRGGVAKRLGLDEAAVREHNPGIIYAAVSSYGPGGPDYSRPGYDAVLQARTGIMGITGDGTGLPIRAGVSLLDMGTGVWTAVGILAALLERKTSGQGQRVDTSLLGTGVMLMGYHLLYRQFAGVNPKPQGSRHTAFAPYAAYQTADGALMVGVSSDKAFARLCAALGHPEWVADARFSSNQDRVRNTCVLDSLIGEVLRGKTTAEWKRALDEADVAADPIQTAEQVLADPQVAAIGQLAPVPLPGDSEALVPRLPLGLSLAPAEIQGPPPRLGEHTRAILQEAGFSSGEIEEFVRKSVCAGSDAG